MGGMPLATERRTVRATRRAGLASLACAAVLLLAACGGSASAKSDGPPAPGNNVGTTLDAALPVWLQQLPLQDEQGRTVRLADFGAKVIVLSDTMTLCQETCPIDTATVVQTAQQVARAGHSDDVAFLSVTVDPKRDSKAQIAAYRKLYAGAPTNWQMLTGSPADIDRLWSYFGVYREQTPPDEGATNWRTGATLTYDVTHSDEVFFLHGGSERFLLEGTPDLQDPDQIPPKLYRYLNDEGRTNLAHPDDGAWTVSQALQTISWLDGTPIG